MTRNQKEVANNYPEIAEALRRPAARRTSSWTARSSPSTAPRPASSCCSPAFTSPRPTPSLIQRVPVFYYIFDVLYAGGRDVRPLPLRERKDILREAADVR